MQFEELLKLVQEVGKAGLSEFEFREGELFIKMSAASAGKQDNQGISAGSQNNDGVPSDGKQGKKEISSDKNSGKSGADKDKPVRKVSSRELFNVDTNIPVRREEPVKGRKREVIEAPVEGIFSFSRLDGTPCLLKTGDKISAGQVLGTLKSRGQTFEIYSDLEGEVVNIYIEDGEELVAREPMVMVAV